VIDGVPDDLAPYVDEQMFVELGGNPVNVSVFYVVAIVLVVLWAVWVTAQLL
jgi:hypothetical protein